MTPAQPKKVPKSKSHMYEQQLAHLPTRDCHGLVERVKDLKPKKWALVIHDKDVRADGQAVEDHVHLMMTFDNARSPVAIAKALGDKPQYVQAWRGDSRNGYAYLIHATDGARGKYQYDPADVIANFDYVAEVASFGKGVQIARQASAVPALLDALYRGDVTREEVTAQMSGSQIAKHLRAVDSVVSERLRRESVEWRRKMIEEGRTVSVYWLYGAAGTGKTSFARDLAQKLSGDSGYFMSGSTRGVFDGYDGQHVMILDELAPNVIPYADLKRITDPFSLVDGVQAPARYRDANLMVETIIVTSPLSPLDLYRAQIENTIDGFDQLVRRVTYPVRMLPDAIQLMEYNANRQRFDVVQGEERDNPYSSSSRQVSALPRALEFGQICDELLAS